MGFKKTYIDKRVLKEQYRYNGYEGLRNLFLTTEMIIYMSDIEFCEDVVRILFDNAVDYSENKIRMRISKILI